MVANLKNKIELDNNYYLRIVSDENEIPKYATNINNLKLTNILKKDSILLIKIDFNNIEKKQYKKILKKLLFIRKMISKNRIGIKEDSKILLGYVINYDKDNKNQSDFILAINAIVYKTRYERYNYIYDTV